MWAVTIESDRLTRIGDTKTTGNSARPPASALSGSEVPCQRGPPAMLVARMIFLKPDGGRENMEC